MSYYKIKEIFVEILRKVQGNPRVALPLDFFEKITPKNFGTKTLRKELLADLESYLKKMEATRRRLLLETLEVDENMIDYVRRQSARSDLTALELAPFTEKNIWRSFEDRELTFAEFLAVLDFSSPEEILEWLAEVFRDWMGPLQPLPLGTLIVTAESVCTKKFVGNTSNVFTAMIMKNWLQDTKSQRRTIVHNFDACFANLGGYGDYRVNELRKLTRGL